MFISLFAIGCHKEKAPIVPEVKEHFATKETNLKQEIYNFLSAANRIPNTANKTNTDPLTDKEPNEGAWLMEAAINVERYGRLDKDVVKTKTYTLDVDNKILPDGLIKMDAVDIIAKYNQIITAIVSDEVNQKVASLIDFQIIEINTDYTRIQVEVNFVYIVEPVVFEPETIVVPESEGGLANCSYFNYNLALGNTFNFDQINHNYYDFSTYNPQTPNGGNYYSSWPDISRAREFIRIAEQKCDVFLYPLIPSPQFNAITLLINNNAIYIPYTNVQIVNSTNLTTILNCSYLWESLPYTIQITDMPFYMDVFISMRDNIEASLPNSNTINYALVQAELQALDGGCTGGQCHDMKLLNTVFVVYYESN